MAGAAVGALSLSSLGRVRRAIPVNRAKHQRHRILLLGMRANRRQNHSGGRRTGLALSSPLFCLILFSTVV